MLDDSLLVKHGGSVENAPGWYHGVYPSGWFQLLSLWFLGRIGPPRDPETTSSVVGLWVNK